MFETKKVEKRISTLVQRVGTGFLVDERVFQAAINDLLSDLKLERTVLINAASTDVGRILLAAQGLSQEEKWKAANRAKDKLINEVGFSKDSADFVVTVLSTALGWGESGVAQNHPISLPPNPTVSSVPAQPPSTLAQQQYLRQQYAGAQYNPPQYPALQKPNRTDGKSFGYGLLGFFIPVVGLVLFLVWKDATPLKAKSAGLGALIGAIISVVFSTIYFIVLAYILTETQYYY